jgi:hypothetical protein
MMVTCNATVVLHQQPRGIANDDQAHHGSASTTLHQQQQQWKK